MDLTSHTFHHLLYIWTHLFTFSRTQNKSLGHLKLHQLTLFKNPGEGGISPDPLDLLERIAPLITTLTMISIHEIYLSLQKRSKILRKGSAIALCPPHLKRLCYATDFKWNSNPCFMIFLESDGHLEYIKSPRVWIPHCLDITIGILCIFLVSQVWHEK